MKKTIILMLCVLTLTGCNLIPMQPYIPTYYFDIGSPDIQITKNDNNNLEILSFGTEGPFNERMVFRTSPNSVKFDEFNRWSMPPIVMLKRYLLMIYDCGNDLDPKANKQYGLNGELIQLEADLMTKKVNVVIRFELFETDNDKNIWTRTFHQQIPVQNITGESFAEAVKYGIDNIIKELNMHLESSMK